MPAAVARENGRRQRRNFNQNEKVDHDQQDKDGKVSNERIGMCKIDKVLVIAEIELTQNAHRSSGNNLIKGKADEGFQPSPE